MNYVILGNGAAGIAAAEQLRKIDKKSEITILSEENYDVYSKCMLPDFLSGELSEDRLFIREKDFYNKNDIRTFYGDKVSNIDFDSKMVLTGTGKKYRYDKLLIASGNKPSIPPIKGLDESNAYFISSLDDAKRIIKDAEKARKVTIIGAGFVGLEAAFGLYKMGKEVTIVHRGARILPRQLDEKAAGIIKDELEKEGIRVILNSPVKEIIKPGYLKRLFGGNKTSAVVLDDGRILKTDMVVVTTGSGPNVEFIKDSTLKVNRGIIVDKHMMTSIKDVYAAGDVVETIDAVSGSRTLSPIWPNAVIQGEFAAYNMAGVEKEFSNLIGMQNTSEFREIPMISMGMVAPKGEGYEEYIDYKPTETIYRKLIIKDNIVVGMIFLGDIRNSGVIGALIKNKINVQKIKHNMLNPNFGYSEVAELI
jgi:nitrite reductase (NADH) large subunit